MRPKCYLVTGALGAGKTTLVRALRKELSVVTIDEFASDVIQAEVAGGGTCLPWIDPISFEQRLLQLQIKATESLPPDQIAFSDRGIPDDIAFLRWYGYEAPVEFYLAARTYRYAHTAFYLPPWRKIYSSGPTRPYGYRKALGLDAILTDTYAELDYNLVKVPVGPVRDRLKFVAGRISRLRS